MQNNRIHAVKIGVIGTGRIAERFVKTSGQNTADISVYNPRMESAARFAGNNGIGAYTNSPEKLYASVDAVYIASPHETHAEYARAALKAGRHVLCEKPLALCREDAEALFALADAQGLILMEAVKTAYCPGFLALLDTVLSGKIGEIVDVEAAFTRLTPTNVRELTDLRCGGSFTELASYGLLPVLLLLGTNWEDVVFFTRDQANGLDAYAKAILDYGDRTGTVKTGLGVKSEGQLLISGTKGYVLAESPWWLTKHFVVRYEDPNRIERYDYPFEGTGMQYEFTAFREAIADLGAGDPGSQTLLSGVTDIYRPVSIASADLIGKFLASQEERRQTVRDALTGQRERVRIWAHRGCSMAYPENTLASFRAAAELGPGLTGIELDVQRTADGQLVVIHDETVDRVSTGHGAVREMTLAELQGLKLKQENASGTQEPVLTEESETSGQNQESLPADYRRIPTMAEVLYLLAPYCRKNGLRINIELKTGKVRYEGIERQVYDLVKSYELLDHIVWSSFLADSIRIIKEIDPKAETGMLAGQLEICVADGDAVNCDAYHPWVGGLGYATPERLALWRQEGRVIRAYNGDEPLYGSGKILKNMDLRDYASLGVTDVFTNVPERYILRESDE